MPKIPQSFIKSVALEIDSDYELNSTPFSDDGDNESKKRIPFIGRTQHIAKFLEFLHSSKNSGVFLVTGFRGMGKTSFVNYVLKTYKEQKGNGVHERNVEGDPIISGFVETVHLTITQNNPQEIEILRLIVSSVYDKFKLHVRSENFWRRLERFYGIWRHLFFGVVLFIVPLIIEQFHKFNGDLHKTLTIALNTFSPKFLGHFFLSLINLITWEHYTLLAIVTIYCYGFIYLALRLIVYIMSKADNSYNRIRRLFERCYNTLLIENDENVETTLPVVNLKLFTGGEKRTKQFPVASSKEIEYELQQFLKRAKREHSLEFIFVFDELDKVEPLVSNVNLYGDVEDYSKQKYVNAYERNLHDRKQAIINIIAGLKNFFTTADARFIFIAGNEMFDASLADISDRQSSISSIFTYIFNIESLLKEKDLVDGGDSINSSSLSDTIEFYLKSLLFPCEQKDLTDSKSLFKTAQERYDFFEDSSTPDPNSFGKVYFTLQAFITYLTYRSNGSPKKLIKEIQEFIKVGDEETAVDTYQTIIGKQREGKKRKVVRYLYFNYYNQYRIGFINYLYRPFLIKYGRSFKLYSDNLIVSTPFLFDHLIKFHPFAFSMSNLELVPEVLSTNKTPALRSHIKKIIEYLGVNHIREIEVGLFDYKFNSRTLNEITYLSKIIEQEAAAMNYTLDESYTVKLHQINKIKELRYIYSNVNTSADKYKQVFSITHLNATLGDLHFFDQEYDDAIVAYSDAIRPLTQQAISTLNMQDFITLNRNRLKLGLCFEKTNSYEDALAQYSNTIMDAVRFMNYRIDNEEFLQIKSNKFADDDEIIIEYLIPESKQEKDTNLYHTASLSDLLQMIQQGFLAQLYIQEKKSVAGTSGMKLFMSLGTYFKITEGFLSHHRRNHIIKANAFLHAGHLMYFKNTDLNFELHADFKQLVPDAIVDNLNNLNEHFQGKFTNEKRPVLSLYLYIIGLAQTSAFSNEKHFIKIRVEAVCQHPNIAYDIIDFHQKELNDKTEEFRSIRYNYIATFLSNIGDSILSHYKISDASKETYNKHSIDGIFDIAKWNKIKYGPVNFDDCLNDPQPENYTLVDVLYCYILAGRYFNKQGRASSEAFQYIKILYLLRLVLTEAKDKDKRRDFIELLEKTVVKPALRLISQNAENTDRHMFNKATSVDDLELNATYALNNLANHPETREVILLFNYVKIRLGETQGLDVENIRTLISPANSFATQHSRLLELAFYARYLDHTMKLDFDNFSPKPQNAIWGENHPQHLANEMIIQNCVDYLYSRLSVLQIMDIYGCDYWMGFSYLAFTHLRVGEYLTALGPYGSLKDQVKQELAKLLGKGSHAGLDEIFHYARAKVLYEKAIQLQTGGDAYKSMIDDLIYLEDDFNDSAYHFGAALDRYLIINGVFANRIERCRQTVANNNQFDPDQYSLIPNIHHSNKNQMSNDKTIVRTIWINASPTQVWDTLTNPDRMQKWMSESPIKLKTNWKQGNPITIEGALLNTKFKNTGFVKEVEQNKILSYSQLSSLSVLPDIPENQTDIQFTISEIKQIKNQCTLTLKISNFPTEVIYRHFLLYWNFTIELVKKEAEKI